MTFEQSFAVLWLLTGLCLGLALIAVLAASDTVVGTDVQGNKMNDVRLIDSITGDTGLMGGSWFAN